MMTAVFSFIQFRRHVVYFCVIAPLVSCAGQQASLSENSANAMAMPDPFMGDWQGAWVSDDGQVSPLVARVIAQGGGQYRARIASTFEDPGSIVSLTGNRSRQTVSLSGEAQEGKLRDTVWHGAISADSFSGSLSGRSNGTFTLMRKVRSSPTLGVKPPSQAMVLFDGADLSKWENARNSGAAAQWTVLGSAMEVKPGSGSLVSKQKLGDIQLHLEFRTPFMPDSRGQARGNSGVYLQGRYEVQVLDSYGLEARDNDCGGVYGVAAAAVNMCAPPMQWQTYDVAFKAPVFDSSGTKRENARMTVFHNGVKIHNDIEVPGPTGSALDTDEHLAGPLMLQDHGDLVQYRNIWLVEQPYEPKLSPDNQAILSRITKAPPGEKIDLIRSLVDNRVYPAVDTLLVLAADDGADVRQAAFEALDELADQRQIAKLVHLLSTTESEEERYAIAKTIAHVVKMDRANDVYTREKSAYWDADDAVKASLYYVDASVGNLEILPEVMRFVHHDNVDVQTSAIRALANWPNPEPLGLLLKIARTGENERQKDIAFHGFVRMISLANYRSEKERLGLVQTSLQIASDNEQKKAALQSIEEMESIAALEMAAAYLGDSALSDVAGQTVMAVSAHSAITAPGKTKDILQNFMGDNGVSAEMQQQVKERIAYIERFDDHLANWQVSGPFTQENATLFEAAFAPETDAEAKWREMPDSTNAANPWLLELDKELGGEYRVAYLTTRVFSDHAQKAMLELGSDDGVKAWLNGQLVHANNVFRGTNPGDDRVEVELQAGWNELMLKVVQASGGWGACARFRAVGGGSLDGLRQH